MKRFLRFAALLALLAFVRQRLHDSSAQVAALREQITDEIVKAFGFAGDGWARRLLGPLFWLPAQVFARIAVGFERQVGEEGIAKAFEALLTRFIVDPQVRGAEHIPAEGPVIIASNHPGAYDAPLIIANLPRNDVKIIFSRVPLVRHLPNFDEHIIEVTRDPFVSMQTIREAVRHLRAGGALLILPTGVVDPDPDLLPGAHEALAQWPRSVALMLQQVPETKLVTAIVSGVLAPSWLQNPIIRLQKEVWRQRKLAEFLQLMQQLLFPGRLLLSPRVSFAPPISASDLGGDTAAMQAEIIVRAQALLAEHVAAR